MDEPLAGKSACNVLSAWTVGGARVDRLELKKECL